MASAFKIEKGVPAPGRRTKYPFGEMEVGDSFFVEHGNASALSNAACSYARYWKKPFKYSARRVDGGARIWRIS